MKGRLIFEAVGSPKEFVTKFLEDLSKEIEKTENVKVLNKRIEEPIEREIEHEGKKVKLYSSFLEVEMEFKDFNTLLDFILYFTPSHIELYEPKELKFKLEELNTILNTISQRMIQLTFIINDLRAQLELLKARIQKVAPRLLQE